MRNKLLIIGAVITLLFGTGCANHQPLMRTPVIVAHGHLDPFADTTDAMQQTGTPVFVASGREPSGSLEPARFYTNERSHVLRLGRAVVEIGHGKDWSEVETLSRAAQRSENAVIKLHAFDEYGVLWSTVPPPDLGFDRDWTAPKTSRQPARRFVTALDNQLRTSGGSDIFVFVHGFNTEYDKNLGIAAELWHYTGRAGAIISFAWPSKHDIFEYQADKANATFATRQFRKLLEFLASQTQAEQIHIIAHSAGNPIVVEALRDLRLMHYPLHQEELRNKTKIGRVVLAAPDMDLLRAINAALDGFDQCAESVALYASTQDEALGFSSMIFGNTRLGASVERLKPEEREALALLSSFEAIDVSQAQNRHSSLLGHSYYHQNPWVSSDIGLYLALGLKAEERGLLLDPQSGFWVFPDNYEDVVRLVSNQIELGTATLEASHE